MDDRYRVDATRIKPLGQPGGAVTDTYLCGFQTVSGDALVLTKAWPLLGNPNDAHDWIILPLSRYESIVVNLMGAR